MFVFDVCIQDNLKVAHFAKNVEYSCFYRLLFTNLKGSDIEKKPQIISSECIFKFRDDICKKS